MKIQDERQAVYPNEGLILHWEAEIAAHEDRINRLKRIIGK